MCFWVFKRTGKCVFQLETTIRMSDNIYNPLFMSLEQIPLFLLWYLHVSWRNSLQAAWTAVLCTVTFLSHWEASANTWTQQHSHMFTSIAHTSRDRARGVASGAPLPELEGDRYLAY